jgi:hypothetical protein
MTITRCRQCRREISGDEAFCPHCGARQPARRRRLVRAPAREPLDLQPDERVPFRFLLAASSVFVLIAVALAIAAVLLT